MNSNKVSVGEFITISVTVAVFTAIQLAYSQKFGRLAVPPTYDDIGYLQNGFMLLNSGYEHGWKNWLIEAFTKTWHAPVAAFQACIGFALTGGALWGPYALNGLYLLALLLVLRAESGGMSRTLLYALIFAILAWPLTAFLIVEFRPDLAAGLFLAVGGWRLAKDHAAVGSGSLRSYRSLWPIAWPFLFALWLKPSYLPVAFGYWLAIWTLVAVTNIQLDGARTPLRPTLVAFAKATSILVIAFAPYLFASWRHLLDYWQSTVFGAGQEIWSPSLSIRDQLNYYVFGDGGRATMKWWAGISIAAVTGATLMIMKSGQSKKLLVGGMFLAFTAVAWAGLTFLSNKSPWFGGLISANFLIFFIVSVKYLGEKCLPVFWGQFALVSALLLLGVSLQRWPADGAVPNLPVSEIPAYAREARRVNTELCNALRAEMRGKGITVLFPVVSTIANPDLVELCGIESGQGEIQAPRIYTLPFSDVSKAIRSYTTSAESDFMAVVLSEDFPSIPGNLPASKHIGSVNQYFESSDRFDLLAAIDGPQKSGQIRVFRKLRQSPTAENGQGARESRTPRGDSGRANVAFRYIDFLKGFGDIEGPYLRWRLPVVIWGRGVESQFAIAGENLDKGALVFEWRPEIGIAAMNVSLGNRVVGRCDATEPMDGEGFRRCEIALPSGNSVREVTLQYDRAGVPSGGTSSNSVLFKQIGFNRRGS